MKATKTRYWYVSGINHKRHKGKSCMTGITQLGLLKIYKPNWSEHGGHEW